MGIFDWIINSKTIDKKRLNSVENNYLLRYHTLNNNELLHKTVETQK